MSFLKAVWVWFKQVKMLPGILAKVANVDRYLECAKELAETKDRLKQVENCLAAERAIKSGRMFFSGNAVWAKGENGKVEDAPYCARCFELNGKTVHLITFQHNSRNGSFRLARCPECQGKDFPIGRPQ